MRPFRHDLAIDLGTANTVIYKDGKLALDEPSAVALLPKDGGPAQFIEVGGRATSAMWENPRIRVVHPLNYSETPHYEGAEEFLLTRLIKKTGIKYAFFDRFMDAHPRILCATPSVIPNSLNDALKSIGKKLGYEAYVMYKPLAAAMNLGRDLYERGGMIVDLGASGSVFSVVAERSIVSEDCNAIAGDKFTQSIVSYIYDKYGTRVGKRTAEMLKIKIGCALPKGQNDTFEIIGPDGDTGIPNRVILSSYEIAECLDKCLTEIENGILKVIEGTDITLRERISRMGIHLIGGSAQLRHLENRLSQNIGIPCKVVDNPRYVVAHGAYSALLLYSGQMLTL